MRNNNHSVLRRFASIPLCLFALVSLAEARTAKPWERVEHCTWINNRWNDGDSFHVQTPGKEIVARLYFVDTPEAETAYRDRLDEQSAYFGITREEAAQVAHEASDFTRRQLAQPFTIWTRWRPALGRSKLGRVYCIILDPQGKDLNELLVAEGLARIYGTKTPLPDGRDSRAYIKGLRVLEAEAKAGRKGAWKFSPTDPAVFPRQTNRDVGS